MRFEKCEGCRVEIVTHGDEPDEVIVRAQREVYSRTKRDIFTFRVIACPTHARYFFADAVPRDEL